MGSGVKFGGGSDGAGQSGRHRARGETGAWPVRRGDEPVAAAGGLPPSKAKKPKPKPTTLAAVPEFVRRVNPLELPDPAGYTHATVARGQIVFLAGQTGMDIDGRIVEGGLVNQFDRALQNMLTALAAAGGGPEHLASLTIYVTDVEEYQENARPIGAVWRARCGGGFPAMALIGVSRLFDPAAEVELQGYGVIP